MAAATLAVAWWLTRAMPPWGDEVHFLETIRLFGRGISIELLRTYPEMSGPLPFVLYAWWGHAVGFETSALRMLSVLIAFATLFMYDRTLAAHGLDGRLRLLLLCLFVVNPYVIGLSVFVFTDMLALFGMALAMHAVPAERFGRAALGLAVATLARQYLVFLAAALVLAAMLSRNAGERRQVAWAATAVTGMAPLAALVWLWEGLSPANELRGVYLSGGLWFDPHALSLYLALPGIYLAPLAVAVCATTPLRPRHVGVAVAAAGFVLLFPIAPSYPQLREGIQTVGFVHRASAALLPGFAVQWPFVVGAFLAWAATAAAVRGNSETWSRPRTTGEWLPLTATAAFLAVMPFSYMPWEKYGLPLLMAVIPVLGKQLSNRRPVVLR